MERALVKIVLHALVTQVGKKTLVAVKKKHVKTSAQMVVVLAELVLKENACVILGFPALAVKKLLVV